MKKPLVIYGLAETALLAYEYFTHDSDYEIAAFTVDSAYKNCENFNGVSVVPFENVEKDFPCDRFDMFVASASGKLNRVRTSMFNKAKAKGYHCPSYVSSKASVWHNVVMGENCFVQEDNTLQPFTTLGDNVVMWSGNHLGHRSVIESHCFVTSHVVISGYCRVEENTFIGVNAALADNITVAKDNFIVMGAVITKSTEPNSVYSGNPAQKREISAKRYCKVLEAV